MAFSDDVKAKIDKLELERQLKDLVDETESAVNSAVEYAGGVAYERRDEVDGWLGKAGTAINEKTKDQYADKVEKVHRSVLTGLDKLAAHRRVGEPVAELEFPTDGPADGPAGAN